MEQAILNATSKNTKGHKLFRNGHVYIHLWKGQHEFKKGKSCLIKLILPSKMPCLHNGEGENSRCHFTITLAKLPIASHSLAFSQADEIHLEKVSMGGKLA